MVVVVSHFGIVTGTLQGLFLLFGKGFVCISGDFDSSEAFYFRF